MFGQDYDPYEDYEYYYDDGGEKSGTSPDTEFARRRVWPVVGAVGLTVFVLAALGILNVPNLRVGRKKAKFYGMI